MIIYEQVYLSHDILQIESKHKCQMLKPLMCLFRHVGGVALNGRMTSMSTMFSPGSLLQFFLYTCCVHPLHLLKEKVS